MEKNMRKLNLISALFAVVVSALGIFTSLYTDIAWAAAQMKGQDAVTIAAAAVLIISSLRRGSKSMIISAGINTYLIYTYFFYALEVRLNPLFHFYLAIVLLSLISLIKSIRSLSGIESTSVGAGAKAFGIIYLCAIASVLAFLWNADIISTLAGSPLLETGTGEPLTIVYVFDLTFVIPAIVYSVYLLKKGRAFGVPLTGIMLVKCVTMGAALLGMTVGAWSCGFRIDTFLAVFWFLLAAAGSGAAAVFLQRSSISE